MTDAEIIKALECCTGHHRGCNTCAYYGGERPCTQRLEADALKLIRSQQETINHFAEANKMVVETDKTEDEILKKLLTQRVKFILNNYDIKVIQRHAVREFANKLKKQAFECDISFGLGSQRIRQAVALDDIDELVNEMFGNSEQQEGEENG